jgi:hypothetical protein
MLAMTRGTLTRSFNAGMTMDSVPGLWNGDVGMSCLGSLLAIDVMAGISPELLGHGRAQREKPTASLSSDMDT